jgi:protein ImuA
MALQPVRSCSTTEMVAALAEQVRRIEGARRTVGEVVSSGDAGLDRLLPEGGLRRGTLVEWLSGGRGSGAATLALAAARQAVASAGALVVVDRDGLFYPPAAVRLGIDLRRLIVVRPRSDEERDWAVDQVLRCRAVSAAWCPIGSSTGHQEPLDQVFRRWQLAAETSGVLGLLVRPAAARQEPSWAELRLWVEPLPLAVPRGAGRSRRLRVELLRARGAQAGAAIELELPWSPGGTSRQPLPGTLGETEHETRPVHLAAQLAPATTRRRSRRA